MFPHQHASVLVYYVWLVFPNVDNYIYVYPRRGDQYGRVRRCEAHLPKQTHQKYFYMWSNSHKKLPGNWQKNSYTTKAAKRVPCNWVELGKKA